MTRPMPAESPDWYPFVILSIHQCDQVLKTIEGVFILLIVGNQLSKCRPQDIEHVVIEGRVPILHVFQELLASTGLENRLRKQSLHRRLDQADL